MQHPHTGPLLSDVPIRTIEREELEQKLRAGDEVRLVMCLGEWEYRAKHIPGSIHFDTPEEMRSGLHENDEIVVYCSNPQCLASVGAYHDLVAHGYRNVRRYAGGVADWEDAGLALEGDRVRS